MSSEDSKNFHPDNKPQNFTVELMERLQLDGSWEIALCDINFGNEISESLYVVSDICNYSYCLDSSEPILRVIYPSNQKFIYFSKKYYIPVRDNNIRRISLYIKNKSGENTQILTERLDVTLHLRRRRRRN